MNANENFDDINEKYDDFKRPYTKAINNGITEANFKTLNSLFCENSTSTNRWLRSQYRGVSNQNSRPSDSGPPDICKSASTAYNGCG